MVTMYSDVPADGATLDELLDRVVNGEVISFARGDVVIAELKPVRQKHRSTIEERRRAIEKLQKLSQKLSLGGLKIRDLINEGRR